MTGHPTPPELYQTEWCPSCRTVRMRMTERAIDALLRQVPAYPEERAELFERTGQRGVPTLVLADGSVHAGSEACIAALDTIAAPMVDTAYVEAHRMNTRRADQRLLEQLTTGDAP